MPRRRRTIEDQLASALAPATAPDQLWHRVSTALPGPRRRSSFNASSWWVMAAAIAALMSGGVLYLRAQGRTAHSPAQVAAALHRGEQTLPGAYAVQRYVVEGESVTIVSGPAQMPAAPGTPKRIRTQPVEGSDLVTSEWTLGSRQWAMVSRGPAHARACRTCHRA